MDRSQKVKMPNRMAPFDRNEQKTRAKLADAAVDRREGPAAVSRIGVLVDEWILKFFKNREKRDVDRKVKRFLARLKKDEDLDIEAKGARFKEELMNHLKTNVDRENEALKVARVGKTKRNQDKLRFDTDRRVRRLNERLAEITKRKEDLQK